MDAMLYAKNITIKMSTSSLEFLSNKNYFVLRFAPPFVKEVFEEIYFFPRIFIKISDGNSFSYPKKGMISLN